MEKSLTRSYIRVNGALWLSVFFMLLMLVNGATLKAVVTEKTFLDISHILAYLKSHTIHLFLFLSSIILAISASKKLAWAHLVLSSLLLFEMIQYVVIEFDKFIIFNIFIFFMLCFYFYFILKNELSSSYYVQNYSVDDLREDFLVNIQGSFNELPEFSFRLTNWDVNGFFAKCERMPESFNRVKVKYEDISIVLEDITVCLVDINQKELGCMVGDASWKKFIDKLSSIGIEPHNLR